MVNTTALSLPSIVAAGIIGSGGIFSITDSNGLCVDLSGGFSAGSAVDFNPIILFPCHLNNDGENQMWVFTLAAPPNIFSITNFLRTPSVLAFPTTSTVSTFQGAVARLNSGITWNVTSNIEFGSNSFNLIETLNGGALNSFGSPLTVETFAGGFSTSQAFNITAV